MALVALGVLAAGVPSRMLQAAGRLAGRADASIPAEPAFVAEEKPSLQPAIELALATAQAPKAPAVPAQEAPPQDSLGDPAKKPQAEVESFPAAPGAPSAPGTCSPCKPKCCAKPCTPRRPLLARLGRCRPITCCGRGLLRRR